MDSSVTYLLSLFKLSTETKDNVTAIRYDNNYVKGVLCKRYKDRDETTP